MNEGFREAAAKCATEATALARRIKSRPDLFSFRAAGDEPGARKVLADVAAELASGEEISARARRSVTQAKAPRS